MADIEKVIENLEQMLSNYDMLDDIVINKNNEMLMFHRAVAKAALSLLKEKDKGKWIDHTYAHGDDIECPFCHKKWNVIDNCTETFDYCPGCGAKLS